MTLTPQRNAVRLISVGFWAVISSLALADVASAQQPPGQPTAVFDVIAEGADDQLASQITAVLKREASENPRYELVQQEQIALLETLLMFDCEEPSPECMSRVGEGLNAKRLIYGRLVAKGDLYDIEVNVFDVPLQRVSKRWNKRFTANTDAIGFFVREMDVFLGGKARAAKSRLRVSANIDNASVLVDGKRVGRTPFVSQSLASGDHEIIVQREGHRPWTHTVTVKDGAEVVLRANLEPIGPPRGAPSPGGGERPDVDSDGMRLATYGWVSVGLGTASILTGAVFAVLMEQTKTDFDDTPYRDEAVDLAQKGDNQATAANVFFGAGAVGILVGTIVILADSHESHGLALEVLDTDVVIDLVPTLAPGRGTVAIDLAF